MISPDVYEVSFPPIKTCLWHSQPHHTSVHFSQHIITLQWTHQDNGRFREHDILLIFATIKYNLRMRNYAIFDSISETFCVVINTAVWCGHGEQFPPVCSASNVSSRNLLSEGLVVLVIVHCVQVRRLHLLTLALPIQPSPGHVVDVRANVLQYKGDCKILLFGSFNELYIYTINHDSHTTQYTTTQIYGK